MQQLKSFRSFVSGRLASFSGFGKPAQVDTTGTTPTLNKTPASSQLQGTMSADTGAVPVVQQQTLPSDSDSQNEYLVRFRHATGIHNHPGFEQNRIAPNKGIYPRVVAAEQKHARNYQLFAVMINSALGLQIVFAAALTALGAGKGSHIAITAFGAMNTIVAGFLTFLKGSGLPNRYKYYQNEMMKVREYVEQREREFARGDMDDMSDGEKELNMRQEVYTIEQMYERVCQDIEANTPDNYISLTKATHGGGVDPPPSLAKRFGDLKHHLGDLRHGAEERFESGRRGIEDRLESGLHGIDRNRRELDRRYTEEKQGLESRLSDTHRGMQETYDRSRQDLQTSVTGSRLGFESRLQDTRRDLEGRIDNTRLGFEDQIGSTRQNIEQDVASTRRGLQSEVTEVSNKVEDHRKEMEQRIEGVETKAKNTEEKALDMVEKMAGKVLAMTSKHHEGRQP